MIRMEFPFKSTPMEFKLRTPTPMADHPYI